MEGAKVQSADCKVCREINAVRSAVRVRLPRIVIKAFVPKSDKVIRVDTAQF
jgi:hypothetical protein